MSFGRVGGALPAWRLPLFNLFTKLQFICGLDRLSVTSQIINTVGCVGHKDSLIITELCCHSIEAAIDNVSVNGYGFIKLYRSQNGNFM